MNGHSVGTSRRGPLARTLAVSGLDHSELLLLGLAGIAAIVVGLATVRAPLLAGIAVSGFAVVVGFAWVGLKAPVTALLSLLPFMVIFEGVLPAQLGTLTAAVAAGALILWVMPLRFDSSLVPIAGFCFAVIALANAIFATDGEQLIQAAKYLLFPAVAVAVTSVRGRELIPTIRTPLLISCAAAMAVHVVIITMGVGASSTYYGLGERLGLAAEGPHALALLAMIVACAGLASERVWVQGTMFPLAAVPVALTAVRSALLGLALALGIFIAQSSSRARTLAILAVIAVVAVASGAADVTTARFEREAGEFGSFATAGSGRGEIWTVALEGWGAAGPLAWVFGTGLRSILGFEIAALGADFIGHSDLVEVLVQLGFIGFAVWIALWVGLLRSALRTLILLPIASFGLVNGTLEYVAPLTIGLVLAAACPRTDASGAEPPGGRPAA